MSCSIPQQVFNENLKQANPKAGPAGGRLQRPSSRRQRPRRR
jgi:hypothetical protein